MEKIKVSVIIPMYNAEKYIEECLKSVLNQTLKEIEIIVIDDGSTDKSKEKVEKYLEKDKRIKLICKKNGGVSKTRNLGVKISSGEYLFFLDSDDYISQDALKKLYEIALNTKSDTIIFNCKIVKSQKQIIWKDTNLNGKISFDNYLKEYFLGNGISSIWNKLWNKKLFLENKIFFPEELGYGEDGVTLIKLLYYSNNVYKIEEEFYFYRDNQNSAMNKSDKPILQYLKAYNSIINFLEEKNFRFLKNDVFNFKLNYVYSNLLICNYFSKKNNDYKKLYENFLLDIKKDNKIYRKEGKLNTYKFIMYKAYQYNICFGEILKILYNIGLKIKKGVEYYNR